MPLSRSGNRKKKLNGDARLSLTLLGHDYNNQTFKPIVVVLIYRPPNSNRRLACNCIKEYINQIPDIEKKELVVIGDLNWDYLDKKTQGASFITEICNEFGLQQLITYPTIWSKGRASLIDLVLSNMSNIYECGCLDKCLSDHNPTSSTIQIV